MSNVNVATGAAKYLRPTLLFIALGVGVIITYAIAISKIDSKKRKGGAFALVAFGLAATCATTLYNFYIYAKETGIANLAKKQGTAAVASMQARLAGAGATQPGVAPAI